ncbi:MAG: potassium channel family protein [Streptosporangiaceae bacterium]
MLWVGFGLLATRYALSNAVYLSLMDLTGSALTSPVDSGAEKTAQVLPTLDGMAFIPVITAIVVGARLTGSVRKEPRPPGGHVIVVGLGNVGTAVTGQLHDLGFDVVCVDNNPGAPGIPMARQLGLPVVIGDAFREQTLRAASLDTYLALVSLTSQDIVNLEIALNARALRDDLRIVLRLTDDDPGRTAAKDDRHLHLSERAVPGGAGLRRRDARTSGASDHRRGPSRAADRRRPGRGPGRAGRAGLAGGFIADTEQDGQARVLALQSIGSAALNWSPHRGYLLADGDRLIVLATRKGLGRFLSVH